MTKDQLFQKLDIEHKEFTDELLEINFYKSLILNAKRTKVQELDKQKKIAKTIIIDNKSLENESMFMTNFMYKDMNGFYKSLGFVEKNIDELMESIEFYHNKQYQWILVDIFELYIKFIENSYKLLEEYDDSIFIADKKKKAYYTIINELREKNHPRFEDFESGKFFKKETNYRFFMQMIKEFRDAIVHQRGNNTSIDYIYNEMKKYVKIDDNFKNTISAYFGTEKYQDMICLNEIYKNEHSSLDRLGYLMEIMIVYSSFILDEFKRLIEFKNG
ncbi:MAG: hypothetical protein PHQ93_05275 [Sulfurimonas sp.]|uniref:hypothetical protein n=1 Tax=Sulfurimonas sp. TaxID=2022749 RepID=UPI002625546D|nr:hypothetical protein [Sulfurimonas sp.]MDD5400582.1 hypothetical protein [Sulfurimonas sp.]